jgi:glycosyltransferase involved in cell wall biosynthesis
VLDVQHRIQPWFPEVSHGRQWKMREDYFQDYLRRAAYVITGTEEGRREIERFTECCPRGLGSCLATPGFALARPTIDVQTRLAALGLNRRYLFYPAQFWPHKNHVNLLQALRILQKEHGLPYELILAGADKGNEAYVRRKVSELGLEEHVRFLGFISQDDLVAIYRGADALVYVTYFGPDNLPPLEAFGLECPVVASAVPGAEEQLGDAALLVPPGTHEKSPRRSSGYMKTQRSALDCASEACAVPAVGRAKTISPACSRSSRNSRPSGNAGTNG